MGRAIREAWWFLWPVFYFAVHVVLLTFVLGFSRWIALDTVREDISEAGTSHPTLLAVFDAFDGVLRAAEAVAPAARPPVTPCGWHGYLLSSRLPCPVSRSWYLRRRTALHD